MGEPRAPASTLAHPALVQLRHAVAPDDLHVLGGARLEIQLRRGHGEGRSGQERLVHHEPVRVGEHTAAGIDRSHLRTDLDGTVEDPGLLGVRRSLHGLEHREVHGGLGVAVAQIADGLAQGPRRLGRALVHENEVHEHRTRLVDRERLEDLGVALVRDGVRLLEHFQVVFAEQDDGGLGLTVGGIDVLDDAVDDRLRPRLEVVADPMEDEEGRSNQDQSGEPDQQPGERAWALRVVAAARLRRCRLGVRLAHSSSSAREAFTTSSEPRAKRRRLARGAPSLGGFLRVSRVRKIPETIWPSGAGSQMLRRRG